MKKFLVIAQTDIDDESNGVWNKVNSQFFALKDLFDFGALIAYKNDSIILRNTKDEDVSLCKINRIPRKILLWNSVFDHLKDNSYDFVYIRYPVINAFVLKCLKKLKNQGAQIIMEIPTFPLETKHAKGKLKIAYFIDKFLHNKTSKYVDRIVFVGNEQESIFNCKAMQIPNGYPNSLLSKKMTGYNIDFNSGVRLVAVSTFMVWHGYDRLLRGLGNYYKTNPDIKFYLTLVGNGPCFDEYKKIIVEENIGEYVRLTGTLSGEKLEEEYKDVSIGIGSLGLHRNNMTEGSTLKTKEYLMRGLPFVLGCKEIGIDSDYEYSLMVPSNDEPIDMYKVLDFAKSLSNSDNKEVSNNMRDYVVDNFSWGKILSNIIKSGE